MALSDILRRLDPRQQVRDVRDPRAPARQSISQYDTLGRGLVSPGSRLPSRPDLQQAAGGYGRQAYLPGGAMGAMGRGQAQTPSDLTVALTDYERHGYEPGGVLGAQGRGQAAPGVPMPTGRPGAGSARLSEILGGMDLGVGRRAELPGSYATRQATRMAEREAGRGQYVAPEGPGLTVNSGGVPAAVAGGAQAVVAPAGKAAATPTQDQITGARGTTGTPAMGSLAQSAPNIYRMLQAMGAPARAPMQVR